MHLDRAVDREGRDKKNQTNRMKGVILKKMGLEEYLKIGITGAFLVWNILEGAVFENVYPQAMVKLYVYPIWRVLLLILLVLAADWCVSIALMLAFTIFFYIMDIEVTREKWSVNELKRVE